MISLTVSVKSDLTRIFRCVVNWFRNEQSWITRCTPEVQSQTLLWMEAKACNKNVKPVISWFLEIPTHLATACLHLGFKFIFLNAGVLTNLSYYVTLQCASISQTLSLQMMYIDTVKYLFCCHLSLLSGESRLYIITADRSVCHTWA